MPCFRGGWRPGGPANSAGLKPWGQGLAEHGVWGGAGRGMRSMQTSERPMTEGHTVKGGATSAEPLTGILLPVAVLSPSRRMLWSL